MKLEIGKVYKTREGEKVEIRHLTPTELGSATPFGGIIFDKPDGPQGRVALSAWAENGRYGIHKDGRDLVSEWRDPWKVILGSYIRKIMSYFTSIL